MHKMVVLVLCLLLMVSKIASQEHRLALVIGNAKYDDKPLPNPENDADDMSRVLKELGFEVIVRKNASFHDMEDAIGDFSQKIQESKTIALFYYAGHGVQVEDKNYLLPVKTKISGSETLKRNAVSLDNLMAILSDAKGLLNIVILDACRDNPFRSMGGRTGRTLGGTRGLVGVTGKGQMMIVYATAPGKEAQDGTGRNGTFTKHLLENIKSQEDISLMLRKVREGVKQETGGAQEPWDSSSLTQGFQFVKKSGEKQNPLLEKMRAAYSQAKEKEASLDIEGKCRLWEEFLQNNREEISASQEDDMMREAAISKLRTYKNEKRQEEEKRKLEEERQKLAKQREEIERIQRERDIEKERLARLEADRRERDKIESERKERERIEEEKKRLSQQDDSYEPNDSRSQAYRIKEGRLSGILRKGNEDWYMLPGSTKSKVTIRLSFKNSEGDLELEMYDESGNSLGSSTSSADEEKIEKEVSGSIYARVYGYSGAGNKYDLAVERKQATEPIPSPLPSLTYGLPQEIWESCKYNHNGEWILDMASERWVNQGFTKQVEYARAYQAGYAREKGLEIEKSFSGIAMRLIPPGRFYMGSPDTEKDRSSVETRHRVIISKAFYVGKYEVTQAQWQAAMGNNPASFKDSGSNAPVETVSWNDCQKFCENTGFKLPTEAQWEYACRAGTTTPFSLGENITPDQVNYDGNYPYAGGAKGAYRQKTVACGSLPNENAWGCYDFHGNVWEWCEDYWNSDLYKNRDNISDPLYQNKGASCVLRGGYWDYDARYCRSALRGCRDVSRLWPLGPARREVTPLTLFPFNLLHFFFFHKIYEINLRKFPCVSMGIKKIKKNFKKAVDFPCKNDKLKKYKIKLQDISCTAIYGIYGTWYMQHM